jgi:hypothetical protein
MACLFLVVFKWARVFSVFVFEFREVVFEKGEYLFAGAEFGVLDEGYSHEVLKEFGKGFSVYVLLGVVSPFFEDKISVIEGHLLGV